MKKTQNAVCSTMRTAFFVAVLALLAVSCSKSGNYPAGTYTGTAEGRNGDVTVTVTLTASKIKDVEVISHQETAGLADGAIKEIPVAIVKSQSVNVDAVSGATITSDAIVAAVKDALKTAGVTELASAKGKHKNVAVKYAKPGTYTGTGIGMNGPVLLDVTFSDKAITDIKVKSSKETEYVGTPAYPIMFKDAIEANGSGVDVVSGATFTAIAVKNALNDAAKQAGASDMDGFKKNKVVHTAQKPIEETYDVVVVGAGGAGMAAAAQAAQNGKTVLVIEKNAEIGGNTLVSGGQYQSVMPYLVWDPKAPDATTGVGFDGNTYNKVKESIATLNELRTILNWNEAPFDADFYKTHEFVAGDTEELAKHGVHAEYLPTLKALKQEIKEYLSWAEPLVKNGAGQLTLFSTVNLHIFQTYYGGLRPSADMSEWCYGDFDLVKQFIEGGQELKQWLTAQGSTFIEDTQPTLIGALWYRENEFIGATIDGVDYPGRWGTYFQAPLNTVTKTAPTASSNKIMLRTTATDLIVKDGRVTGVKATMYDGTPVTANATNGVVLSTGGYAANLNQVVDTNVYWSSEYVSKKTKTTNRSSLQGDGLAMGRKAGADVTGEGFTQMMPISWIDNGQLAFGGGNYAVYLNPTTGKRFVDETSERDVLSLAEFRNGIEHDGTKGVFIEVANLEARIPGPYPYTTEDVEWRQYVRTIDQVAELFNSLGITASADTVRETIENYDKAVMAGKQPEGVKKTNPNLLIGKADKDAKGNYIASTYTLDGVPLRIRFMAPSTHHTMGGLCVDIDRRVLDSSGHPIKGLYAAGEVTGGIHGGNRLGGNAIVEIFVSGRTAANAISKDN